ncbi:MAG: signal peptidase II [Acidobacteriia bacterium]|nr:signal peptidase II [Terriglobia bacterium]
MKAKFILITSIVLGVDLLTKHLVSTIPRLQGIAIVPHYVHISFAANSGIFFRLLDDFNPVWKPYLLAGMAMVPVLVIIIYSIRRPSGPVLLQAALALIAGGLLGNFADRILHGAVIDFIEVHVENSIYYPTFNVADLAIVIGIAMLLIRIKRRSAHARKQTQLVSE